MNKKGFTLFEVIVSIVLISIVLISMMSTLVKLKESYEVVYTNTDALIYSSSVTRIINNDFEANGGIRHIDCDFSGSSCDITLNNEQQRRLAIYNVYLGHEVKSADNLKYYKISGNTITGTGTVSSTSANPIFCEEVEIDGVKKVYAECGQTGSNPVRCTCAKEIIATTLKYSDTTNILEEKNIYLKTLKVEKNTALVKETLSGYNRYVTTGQSSTNGYNFGKIAFTNMIYNSSSRFVNNDQSKPYKNSISTITIEINDGIDVLDPTYNIYLSSASVYDPTKVQTGQELCFGFNNKAPSGTTVTQNIDGLCMKYGVGFLKRTGSKKEKLSNNEIPVNNLPKLQPSSKIFDGYYYNFTDPSNPSNNKLIQIVDGNGKIKISTNFFDSEEDVNGTILLEAKWK